MTAGAFAKAGDRDFGAFTPTGDGRRTFLHNTLDWAITIGTGLSSPASSTMTTRLADNGPVVLLWSFVGFLYDFVPGHPLCWRHIRLSY